MKLFRILIIALSFHFVAYACQSKKLASNQIEVTGILQKQGMTTYQYGTHTLTSNGKQFALKSSTIDLNKYLKQNVTIIGEKIAGYPVENGPEYMEVIKVK